MADLHCPTSGVVELPHRMFWQADPRLKLDDPFALRRARLAAAEQSQPNFDAWLARQEAAA